jgi:hypothetical protein
MDANAFRSFDLDPPLEVDDEYWEGSTPEESFKQPKEIPSTTSFFNALIKLDQMLSFALRTSVSIYNPRRFGELKFG